MATAPTPLPEPLLVGETVHYRDHDRCWAAAIVESAPGESVQLYLFPLPPSHSMPQAPGTFVRHDPGRANETWHRLAECGDVNASRDRGRKRRRRRAGDSAQG